MLDPLIIKDAIETGILVYNLLKSKGTPPEHWEWAKGAQNWFEGYFRSIYGIYTIPPLACSNSTNQFAYVNSSSWHKNPNYFGGIGLGTILNEAQGDPAFFANRLIDYANGILGGPRYRSTFKSSRFGQRFAPLKPEFQAPYENFYNCMMELYCRKVALFGESFCFPTDLTNGDLFFDSICNVSPETWSTFEDAANSYFIYFFDGYGIPKSLKFTADLKLGVSMEDCILKCRKYFNSLKETGQPPAIIKVIDGKQTVTNENELRKYISFTDSLKIEAPTGGGTTPPTSGDDDGGDTQESSMAMVGLAAVALFLLTGGV